MVWVEIKIILSILFIISTLNLKTLFGTKFAPNR